MSRRFDVLYRFSTFSTSTTRSVGDFNISLSPSYENMKMCASIVYFLAYIFSCHIPPLCLPGPLAAKVIGVFSKFTFGGGERF